MSGTTYYRHVFWDNILSSLRGREYIDVLEEKLFRQLPGTKVARLINDFAHNKGGFTLAINPELKTIGIALCSFNDHFNRKEGRWVASCRAAFETTEYDPWDWVILAPDTTELSVQMRVLLQMAINDAFGVLLEMEGDKVEFPTIVIYGDVMKTGE